MDCGNNTCQNVFIHNTADELSAAFTELWVKIINENERKQSTIFENMIVQTIDSKI